MNKDIYELALTANGLFWTSNEKETTWRNLLDWLAKGQREIVFDFSFDYYSLIGEDEDVLSVLLDFTVFVGLVSEQDNLFTSIKKIILNIFNAPLKGNEYWRLNNIIVNHYKLLLLQFKGKLEIKINYENVCKGSRYKQTLSQVTQHYLPAFPMNLEIYEKLFYKPLKECFPDIEDCDFMARAGNAVDRCTQYLACFFRENLLRDAKDRINKKTGEVTESPLRKALLEWVEHPDTQELTLMDAILTAVYYNNCKNIGGKKVTYESAKELLDGYYVAHAKAMAAGIREICENILKHTDMRTGMFFLRVHENRNAKMLGLPPEYGQGWTEWIEFSIADFNQIGILDKYRKDNTIKMPVSLNDMFTFAFDAQSALVQLQNIEQQSKKIQSSDIYHLLFQIGLKVFKNLLITYNGYFSVSTVDEQSLTGDLKFTAYDQLKISESPGEHKQGTKYRIILPLMEREAGSKRVPGMRFATHKFDYYKAVPEYLERSDVYSFSWKTEDGNGMSTATTDTASEIMAEVIEKERQQTISNKSNPNAIVFDFTQLFTNIPSSSFDINKLIYYYLQSALFMHSDCSFVLLTGLTKDIIYNFRMMYLPFLFQVIQDNKPKGEQIAERKCPLVYLFDEEGEAFIISWMNEEKNKICNSYYRTFRIMDQIGTVEDVRNFDELTPTEKQALLFPVEVLPGEGLESPAFKNHILKLLTRKFGANQFGMKHNEHVKLGSKIHADTFYQAELLFENSYYTDCFAYLLARDILKKTNGKKKIILVGYKEYTKMLVEKTKHLLKAYDEIKRNGQQIEEYKQSKTVNTITFHEDSIRLEDECKRVRSLFQNGEITIADTAFVFVVPISSSLKTFNKIYADIIRALTKNENGEHSPFVFNYARNNPPLNYSMIELRDQHQDKPTELEMAFGWQKIKNNVITIAQEFPHNQVEKEKDVQCFLIESARWHKAFDCDECNQNKTLLKTHNSSLILSDNVGLPHIINRKSFLSEKENEEKEKAVLNELCAHLRYGHISRGQNDFLYYFDTWRFFKELRNENNTMLYAYLNEWKEHLIENLKIVDTSADTINILLVPEHYSNSAFIEWVLSEVFSRTGIVIREDFNKEFYSNFKEKYRYIRNNKANKRFFFVDDILTSGHTFSRCRAFAEELLGEHMQTKDERAQEAFITTITLMTRLDHQNYTLIERRLAKDCNSFLEIYIPVIKEQTEECWLCEEEINLCVMAETIIDDRFRSFLKVRKEEYLDKVVVTNGYAENFQKYIDRAKQKYIQQRFLLANKIYFKLAGLVEEIDQLGQDYDEENLKKQMYPLLGLNDDGDKIVSNMVDPDVDPDLSYNMNLVRVICMPFLNCFKVMRKIALRLCISELNTLLRLTPKPEESNFVYSQKYLLLLVTQLSMLNALVIINKESLREIFYYLKPLAVDLKNDPFLYYRYALKRLCMDNHAMELILIRNAIALLKTNGNDPDFCAFLEWLILENNGIIANAAEYLKRDKKILLNAGVIEAGLHKIIENYYYEICREMWGEFEPDYDLKHIYSALEVNGDFEMDMAASGASSSFESRANRLVGRLTGSNEDNVFFYSRGDDGFRFMRGKALESEQYKPSSMDIPIFKVENTEYCANFRIDESHHCVVKLGTDYYIALLYFKILLLSKKDMQNAINNLIRPGAQNTPNIKTEV